MSYLQKDVFVIVSGPGRQVSEEQCVTVLILQSYQVVNYSNNNNNNNNNTILHRTSNIEFMDDYGNKLCRDVSRTLYFGLLLAIGRLRREKLYGGRVLRRALLFQCASENPAFTNFRPLLKVSNCQKYGQSVRSVVRAYTAASRRSFISQPSTPSNCGFRAFLLCCIYITVPDCLRRIQARVRSYQYLCLNFASFRLL